MKNLLATPRVAVRVADRDFEGTARVVDDPEEDNWARRALIDKCQKTYSGDLRNWGRDSLPIAVDIEMDAPN